jgi:hypothetical protein
MSNPQVDILKCARFRNSLELIPTFWHLISAKLSFIFFQRNSVAVLQNVLACNDRGRCAATTIIDQYCEVDFARVSSDHSFSSSMW